MPVYFLTGFDIHLAFIVSLALPAWIVEILQEEVRSHKCVKICNHCSSIKMKYRSTNLLAIRDILQQLIHIRTCIHIHRSTGIHMCFSSSPCAFRTFTRSCYMMVQNQLPTVNKRSL